MGSEPVTYDFRDGIATLTMDDGKANVMSAVMQDALGRALDQAEADDAVVVLTGRPKLFSGGYDMAMFSRSADEVVGTIRGGGELCARLLAFPRPVVAACTGHAVAQGAFLLLACDVRIGAIGPFKIGLNEVAIGLTVPWYGVELARFRLTRPGFNHAVITGALFPPERAAQAGFLDHLVQPEEVGDHAHREAKRLTTINAIAHTATKLRVREPVLEAMRAGIARELIVAT